jgi:hypothetical protein
MSLYPNRKKLTEYPTVTPTLADSVVNIQSSTVKQSTLQSILNLFNNNLPQATEFVKGAARLATQPEVNAGIDDSKIITPLKLSSFIGNQLPIASETNKGIIELATQTETNTGTDDTRAITPLKLANRIASETLTGIAEIATQAEVTTGTDDTRFITPLKLRQNQFNSATVTSTAINPFTVTLNSIAGNIIIPTGVGCNIISGTGQLIVLNNTFLTTTSVIEYTIRSYGKMLMQGGYNVSTGQANISVYNADINTVTQLNINFRILNS